MINTHNKPNHTSNRWPFPSHRRPYQRPAVSQARDAVEAMVVRHGAGWYVTLALWCLRILVRHADRKALFALRGDALQTVAAHVSVTGARHGTRPAQHRLLQSLQERLDTLEASADAAPSAWPQTLRANLRRLADLLGLDDTEQRILVFALAIRLHKPLARCVSLVPRLERQAWWDTLADVVGLDVSDLHAALAPRAPLLACGLISASPRSWGHRLSDLWLLRMREAVAMLDEEVAPHVLAGLALEPVPSAEFELDDFAHLGPAVSLLKRLLQRPAPGGPSDSPSINLHVLLHGASDLKEALAATLTQAAGRRLWSVPALTPQGGVIDPPGRVNAYRRAQDALTRAPAALVFTGVDDVFSRAGWAPYDAVSQCAAVQGLMAQSHVPTFWITDHPAHLERSVLQRMDLVIEVPDLPAQALRSVLQRDGLLGDDDLMDDGPGHPAMQVLPSAWARRTLRRLRAVGIDDPAERLGLAQAAMPALPRFAASPPADLATGRSAIPAP